MNKTAIVFGGSGLVGTCLIKELADSDVYVKVISVGRRTLGFKNKKIEELVVDFNLLEESLKSIHGDEVYICLGTTIKKAGSVKRMEQIDRDLPIDIAQLMFMAGVNKVAVVSSVGANAQAKNYYLRIKGEMEEGIRNIAFHKVAIVRPSIILGKRSSQRFGESLGKVVMKAIGFLMIGDLRKYRAIHAQTIARSMIKILSSDTASGVVFESDKLQKLGK